MSLSHIDAKLAYVRQSLSAKEIDRLTATNTDEYLVLDLIYCITKHHNWLSVPVFQHLLCASLVNRHGLEFDACQRLLATTTTEFIKIKCLNPVESSDSNFIRYVFILTLSTTDEQKLMLELGFGLLFLRKLKDFLRQVAKGDKTQSFLFGFEAVCYETLVSLADDLMDNPAKLASYRLQYHLTQAQDNASENTIAQDKVDNVLNLLRRMRNNSFTVQDIAAALPASLSAQSLVVMLARSGLIYHSDFLARKKLYVWRITALGEEIAALAQDSALAKC